MMESSQGAKVSETIKSMCYHSLQCPICYSKCQAKSKVNSRVKLVICDGKLLRSQGKCNNLINVLPQLAVPYMLFKFSRKKQVNSLVKLDVYDGKFPSSQGKCNIK